MPLPETDTRRDALVLSDLPRFDPLDLRGFERAAVAVCEWVNTQRAVKGFIQFFVRHVTANWINAATGRLHELHGLDHVRDLRPTRGVVLVSNHRSFFDMYIASAVLYRHARFMDRLYFPVRTDFFYTHPLGLLVNLSISGGAMWPPVFRDDRRFRLNPTGIAQMVHALRQPGAVLGIHPEGTRGKGPDPYDLLPARPGVGHLLKACDPDTLVVPFFIHGLGNDFAGEIVRNFRGEGRRGHPVRLTFGPARPAGTFDQGAPAQDLAEALLEVVRGLGVLDRAVEDRMSRA